MIERPRAIAKLRDGTLRELLPATVERMRELRILPALVLLGIACIAGAASAQTGNCFRLDQLLTRLNDASKPPLEGAPDAASLQAMTAVVAAGDQAKCASLLAQAWGIGKAGAPTLHTH